MESQFNIQWIPTENLISILPLAFVLNGEKIPLEVLEARLSAMIPMGYKCIGVYDGERLVGICGVWELNKLYAGKHLEPDNVIIDPEYQGKKIGEAMMSFLNNYAEELDCDALEVNCYAKNIRGKKFWENQGYEPLGIHLIKKLKA
ncbi:GNAT family N-acetyltransferase [Flagellimonas zhangzhouensis]|uniref:Acetyltransferase (GNAT) domain-containing protein n=1 Tax=Flagellimonas zhangzhouensis TaxID=1073328 RepID=A0A1H2SMP9_9FLAO|nr:GNAT family N-acetyltransferase [Allomuricauda zhangzhouensis]SDQ76884.1 Acetyltransferase (GNAT) domain-containing protein [Allomuricauda zhangzhouensis]SDW32870.1 Acetyltransferase (GNAT) domain-containing protein [Allomuricauda zhangzhouensis]